MSRSSWGRDWRLWLPAAVLLAVNLAAWVVFQLIYADRVEERSGALERARAALEQVTDERRRAERYATLVEQNTLQLVTLYDDRLKTQEERLTRLIAEVKDLAERAGLDPATIRYPDQSYEERGLIKRSIVFGVDGTYVALRRLVNLLEVTDSFVVLEEVRTGGRGKARGADGRLSIDLAIATYFLEDDVEAERLARNREVAAEAS